MKNAVIDGQSALLLLVVVPHVLCSDAPLLPSEELSDEYQTDYDEETVESALSDMEAFTPGSELTEGEETADTAETVCNTQCPWIGHMSFCGHFDKMKKIQKLKLLSSSLQTG